MAVETEVKGRRSRDDHAVSILSAVSEGFDTKFKIMHASFLTLHMATKCIEQLVDEGLLLSEADSKKFKLSSAGRLKLAQLS